MLLALALRICGQQPDAEEVVLDTFMQAWRDAHRYDASRATVAGWLTTIARSRALITCARECADSTRPTLPNSDTSTSR